MRKHSALVEGAAVAFALTMTAPLVAPITIYAATTASQQQSVTADIMVPGERTSLFDTGWRFKLGDVKGAEAKTFDDATWRSLDLPHDYSIEQGYDQTLESESGFLPGGVGWYRKSFTVSKKYQGKQLVLGFDGVYMNAKVYVNGKEVAHHPYGYTPFAIDITDELVMDGSTQNVVAVRVDHKTPSSRWYSGSGIFRDVTLTATDKLHVAQDGMKVVADAAKLEQGAKSVPVSFATTVRNDSDSEKSFTVKASLAGAADTSHEVRLAPGEEKVVEQSVSVSNPKLWSTEAPNLYDATVEVVSGGKTVDAYTQDFGFRYFKFDRNTGFSLNGKKMKLQGVSMHHDQGALGSVANPRAIERQVQILKDMGVNAIRVTHNPAAKALIDACNREGVMVVEEAFDGWSASKNGNTEDFGKHFKEACGENNGVIGAKANMTWAEFDMKAMVKRDRNAPAVIMWSLGNEIIEGVSGNTSDYPQIAKNLIDWMKECDTTRPATVGDNKLKAANSGGVTKDVCDVVANNGGVVGLNYTDKDQFKNVWGAHGNWTMYGSETASAVHSRGWYSHLGKDDKNLQISDYDNDAARVGWGRSASNAWLDVLANDCNAGEFVWTGFDYLGEPTFWNSPNPGSVSGHGPIPNSSFFGIVDTAGFPKDTYYLYRSQWNKKSDTLSIAPSTWNDAEIAKEGGKVRVDVFTSAPKVELFLNGRSLGVKTSTEKTTPAGFKYRTFDNGALYPTWKVDWAAGELTVKAWDAKGKEITADCVGKKSVKTSSAAASVDVTADRKEVTADGRDLVYFSVQVKDGQGNPVPAAMNRINFSVKGEGKLVGVDSGNPSDTEGKKGDSKKAFMGKALAIVETTEDAGQVSLTATSEGLASDTESARAVPEASEGEAYLKSYEVSQDFYVPAGEKPELPATVSAKYSDGTTKDVAVKWTLPDEDKLAKPGVYAATGTLEGTDLSVNVKVHVIGDVVAMRNLALMTTEGVAPSLPKLVPGVLANGSLTEEFAVSWDAPEASAYKQGKNVVVNGTATVLGESLPVTATVRVLPPLEKKVNLAARADAGNTDVPTFSNGHKKADGTITEPSKTAISDSFDRLNDGNGTDVADLGNRWSNWALRGAEGAPLDTYLQVDWAKEHTIDTVKLHFLQVAPDAVVPNDNGVHFQYWDSEANAWKDIAETHITIVPATSGDTPFGFEHPVKTSKLRVWMKAPQKGKCIGLTEIEVYNAVTKPASSTEAALSGISLGGTALNGFAGDKTSYTVDLAGGKAPEVSATAEANMGITVLPVHENVQRILTLAEDGKTTKTYEITYTGAPVEPEQVDKTKLQQLVDSCASYKAEDYTAESWKPFALALDDARDILADADAKEADVDAAYQKLLVAKDALKAKGDSPNPGPDSGSKPDSGKPAPHKTEGGLAQTGDPVAIAGVIAAAGSALAAVGVARKRRR